MNETAQPEPAGLTAPKNFCARAPLDQPWAWLTLVGVLLASDFVTGREIHFPLFYAIPIALASWNGSRKIAISLAVGLPAIRFFFNFAWPGAWTLVGAGANEVISGMGLLGVALLTSRLATLHDELNRRVKTLEGVLPICSFCKRIRDGSEHWVPFETYLCRHSTAELTHGLCVDCADEHYPGVLAPKLGAARPSGVTPNEHSASDAWAQGPKFPSRASDARLESEACRPSLPSFRKRGADELF